MLTTSNLAGDFEAIEFNDQFESIGNRRSVAYAQAWCRKATPEYEQLLVRVDTHSPARFRVNGPLSNLPEFWEAFSCQEGAPMRRGADACEVWETTPVDETFLQPVESEIPVLIISGYYDPSTPISMGEKVAAHLPNSRHVMVRNESHGAEFGCARPAAIQFLTSGSLAGLGPICEDVGPIRYEVSP